MGVALDAFGLTMPPPYSPVRSCIYCGAKRYSIDRVKLGNEHIVPLCLDGKEILPEASCKKCESKTGGVEQYLFGNHGIYRAARIVVGSDSRNKDAKTTPLYLNPIFENGRPVSGHRVDFPADQSGPRYSVLVSYSNRPSVLRGFAMDHADGELNVMFLDLANPGVPTSSYSLPNFSPPGLDIVKLCRLLAKIAHAHATAELGMGGFEPFLPDFIRGRAILQTVAGVFGHHNEPFFPGGNFDGPYAIRHSIQPVGNSRFVVVDIALLTKTVFPRYSVVAGQMSHPIPAS